MPAGDSVEAIRKIWMEGYDRGCADMRERVGRLEKALREWAAAKKERCYACDSGLDGPQCTCSEITARTAQAESGLRAALAPAPAHEPATAELPPEAAEVLRENLWTLYDSEKPCDGSCGAKPSVPHYHAGEKRDAGKGEPRG